MVIYRHRQRRRLQWKVAASARPVHREDPQSFGSRVSASVTTVGTRLRRRVGPVRTMRPHWCEGQGTPRPTDRQRVGAFAHRWLVWFSLPPSLVPTGPASFLSRTPGGPAPGASTAVGKVTRYLRASRRCGMPCEKPARYRERGGVYLVCTGMGAIRAHCLQQSVPGSPRRF